MTSDADLVADALRRAVADHTLNGEFRAAALRRFPVETAARLLRQEIAEALELPHWRLRDRIVDHLFATEGNDCVTGPVTLPDGTTVSGGPGRILAVRKFPSVETLEP